MSSPYRDLDGDPCPRCGSVLVVELGDLVCTQGCGVWVPRAEVITLLGDVILQGTGAVPYWKIEPLPLTACFRCAESLDAVYAKLGEGAIAFGQCIRHGIWVERGTREHLVTVYASRAATLPHARDLRVATSEPRVATLEDRVTELEERVAHLERLLTTKRPVR